MKACTLRPLVWGSMALFGLSINVYAEDELLETETIEVIGVTPTLGVGLPETKIPYKVQSATADDMDKSISLDITDFINRNFSSVIVNDAQNNPLQPDIQYRGFTASPLLGLPQGLAVYQNGVRVNEVFGDTINWDLIPKSSIANMNLIGGANPVFGLNTLGGAISIQTKTGFSHPGHSAEIYGGSFERIVTTVESGANNGTLGYFTTFQYFDEEGWRDLSPSEAINFFSALSYRDGTDTSVDLNFNYADTELFGNGPIPVELAAIDRKAYFTAPDITDNRMYFIQLQGEHWLNDLTQLSGNAFIRDNDTKAFNGDGSEFEECDPPDDAFLCDEEEPTMPIEDQNGNSIAAADAQGDRNAINNRSRRDQQSRGFNLQTTFLQDLFTRQNQFIVGGGYYDGEVDFNSNLEIARLTGIRTTEGTGLFVPEAGTVINSTTQSWYIYLTDTLSLSDKLDLTLSGRYNNTAIELQDRGGFNGLSVPVPALNGEHNFERLNPAVGLTYAFETNLSGYASYSESSRAPTAIELACADPDAPCRLPNGFLADPPLEQVVARSVEGGIRGSLRKLGWFKNIDWQVGGFFTRNQDDIIFQNTGGVSGNVGFFDNVGDTQRLGTELALTGQLERLSWFMNYSFVKATYESTFQVSSANNPLADANGLVTVSPGDNIPNIPDHSLKFGGEYFLTPKLTIGGDVLYKSGIYVRGDPSNLLGKLDGYTTVNLRGQYAINEMITVFARINNLFDEEYATFGLLGEPDEIPGFGGFTDNRFIGVGAPISGFVGIRVQI